MDDPESLLAGPRGRRLCLELAGALARDAATLVSQNYLRAAFFAAYGLDPGRGTSRVMLATGHRGPEPEPDLPSAPSDVARLLAAVPAGSIDDRALLNGLTEAVGSARYWQEPDGEDVLAATPAMREALLPIAAAVLSSGLATWWAAPLDRASQRNVTFVDPEPRASPIEGSVAEHLTRWRASFEHDEARAEQERPTDPRAAWSGAWWSIPPSDLVRTTRTLGARGPVGLWLVEDGFGWDRATVRPVPVPDGTTVYELDGPQAWAELCRRFPLEVAASRRHVWYRTTSVAGRWVIPDWSRVAQAFDAVHLTVAGYLETAGRAVPVTEETSSVLAGWGPDETYWLTDVAHAADAEQAWIFTDDTWRRDLP